ncbi:MAG: DNA polymerase III subunit delta [Phycisphaeraceae bacterium]|nr:DNA polymerase III subunit delta [Phycisphaeraceae bacterium]
MARSSKKAGALDGSEPIVVLYGSESFLQRQKLDELQQCLVEGSEPAQTIRFDGKSASLAEVLDELRSYGLMQQRKCVVVDGADPFVKDHREALERYAQDPSPIATLVLRPETWQSNWKLHKAIQKVGAVIKCEPLNESEAQAWLGRRAREAHGVKLPARAASLLIEHLGTDLSSLDNELAKLAVGCGADKTIGVDQIEDLVGFASDQMAWAIQEAMLEGDPERILATLHELVHLSGQPEQLIGYFMSDLVRKLCIASAMSAQGAGRFEICKTLKIWPQDRQAPFLAAAGRLGGAKAARLFGEALQIDRRGKSGFVRSGENLRSLERVGVHFAKALG